MNDLNAIDAAAGFAIGKAVTPHAGADSRTPQGDALAPRRGAAQPPLDLSLGHIRTTEDGRRVLTTDGPVLFRLNIDTNARTAVLRINALAFRTRTERRAAQKRFRDQCADQIVGMQLSYEYEEGV